jgi:phage tail sheath protein FI
MANVDNKKYPWYAPAGLERGQIDCTRMHFFAKLEDEDTVYDGRINALKTFSQDGVKVWGNKTAYSVDSPLNRINVRRLMIRVKKLVTEAARHLIFEQYTDTLEKQFRGLVEPILAEVKSKRGIYDYRIKTEVTPETRDQHILPCRILIKPTSALEYISISFVVYPESISFED